MNLGRVDLKFCRDVIRFALVAKSLRHAAQNVGRVDQTV
jgi:hypothetical protein